MVGNDVAGVFRLHRLRRRTVPLKMTCCLLTATSWWRRRLCGCD
jgi:hypothetical protein